MKKILGLGLLAAAVVYAMKAQKATTENSAGNIGAAPEPGPKGEWSNPGAEPGYAVIKPEHLLPVPGQTLPLGNLPTTPVVNNPASGVKTTSPVTSVPIDKTNIPNLTLVMFILPQTGAETMGLIKSKGDTGYMITLAGINQPTYRVPFANITKIF